MLLAEPGLMRFSRGAGEGGYLGQLGLQARLLSQSIIDGLQEAPLNHVEGLEHRGDRDRAQGSRQFRTPLHLMLERPN